LVEDRLKNVVKGFSFKIYKLKGLKRKYPIRKLLGSFSFTVLQKIPGVYAI
jgi:hypothetical protein